MLKYAFSHILETLFVSFYDMYINTKSYLQLGSRAQLRALEAFWIFNAQMCILSHFKDSFSLIFDTYFNTKS